MVDEGGMQAPKPGHREAARKGGRRQRSADGPRETGPALEACYRWLLWLIPTLERFPRSQKFLLGDRLQTVALDVQDHLIAATFLPHERAAHLRQANLGLEKLRLGTRLAMDLGHLDFARYEHAARSLDEIGRLVGGWLRTHIQAQPLHTDHAAPAD